MELISFLYSFIWNKHMSICLKKFKQMWCNNFWLSARSPLYFHKNFVSHSKGAHEFNTYSKNSINLHWNGKPFIEIPPPQNSDFSGEYEIGFALGKNLGKATEYLTHSLFHSSRPNLPDWSDVKRHIPELICLLSCFSPVRLFVTLCTVARQAPLSMEFSRQESWSGLPFSSSRESS